jgi:hypothetical protein
VWRAPSSATANRTARTEAMRWPAESMRIPTQLPSATPRKAQQMGIFDAASLAFRKDKSGGSKQMSSILADQ